MRNSFFGIDRLGPPQLLWVSQNEYVELEGTHRGPTRLAGVQEDGFLYGPRGETIKYLGPQLVGLSEWLPND